MFVFALHAPRRDRPQLFAKGDLAPTRADHSTVRLPSGIRGFASPTRRSPTCSRSAHPARPPERRLRHLGLGSPTCGLMATVAPEQIVWPGRPYGMAETVICRWRLLRRAGADERNRAISGTTAAGGRRPRCCRRC
jgi:hypothetical protein